MTEGYEATDPKEEFRTHYIRLRTILDGLEATALRYCLADKKATVRIQRSVDLEKLLMPVVEQIQSMSVSDVASTGGCGDGYTLCNGVCVPYICPEFTES
jgi:hypothetical protein